MANFEIKTDLPKLTQAEIDRISAIPAAQRLVSEAAYLTSLSPYLTNEIIDKDVNGLILRAAGNTVPTGYAGFKKGALFTKKDATGRAVYENSGDETTAAWDLIGETSTSDLADLSVTAAKLAAALDLTGKDVKLKIKNGTPVNAVAATRVLTVSGVPTDNDTVIIGSNTYKFQSAIGVATKANGTLAFADIPANTNTVVIGNKTYTFKTALTEAAATGVLTATGNFVDSETVTIGSRTYKFTVNLSTPAVVNEVKIGANASASLDNLIAAINHAAGEGTTYSTGTVVHADVTAAAGDGDTMNVTAKVKGVAGNSIASTVAAASCSFGAAALANGADAVANEIFIGVSAEACLDNLLAAINAAAGEGTTYSTGTVAHTQVDATKDDASHLSIDALVAGDAGNAIATTVTGANHSFAAATLTGGEGAEAANDVLIGASAEDSIDNLVAAINAAAGEGTTYGTGTVAHPLVSAAKTAADKMTITAKVKGIAANAIATTKSGTNLAWAGATMAGGTDGTVGVIGEIYADASYLYIAKAANTVADQNWRRIDLGSAY